MSNFDDFDLDLKKVKNNGINATWPTFGAICNSIIETIKVTMKYCPTLEDCAGPSERNHPSCRGPLNDGTIQINC